MATVKEIIQRNNATFYDYQSKKVHSPYGRMLKFLILSLLASILFDDLGDSFLNSVLAVQSILIGFSFSVLFFLVSGSISISEQEYSREKKYRIERLNTLATELFYNVAYYNTVSIFSVVLALLFLLPNFSIFSSVLENSLFQSLLEKLPPDTLEKMQDIGSRFLTLIFVFLFSDSVFTFFRIVRRVNFFFSEKLSLKA
jgi:hypothetical protein